MGRLCPCSSRWVLFSGYYPSFNMPPAESQIHSPALLGLPLQEGLLCSISEVQPIPFSKCCLCNKGTDCLSWCSWLSSLRESSHMVRATVWFTGVTQQGRERKAFLQILPSSECYGHRSLLRAEDLICRNAAVIPVTGFSWAALSQCCHRAL